jgi:Asp-tRNA(Asn)/Glu-tRNA(Gln) amidotransferase A subunit family amidase
VGLKPTFGRVSVQGVIPLSTSLDHVGPLTSSVADAAAVFDAIADENPVVAPGIAPLQSLAARGTRNIRVGVPRHYFFEDLDPEVSSATEAALATLQALVGEMREIKLTVREDRALQTAEAYAYHADSVARTPELYDRETLRRIRTGEKYGPEDRARAIAKLAQERHNIQAVFGDVDVLVTPTLPIPPPMIASMKENPEKLRPAELLLLRNTRPFNVWGIPAISIPCGFTSTGLPIGLQIAGPHWGEAVALAVARAYERVTEWHTMRPPL